MSGQFIFSLEIKIMCFNVKKNRASCLDQRQKQHKGSLWLYVFAIMTLSVKYNRVNFEYIYLSINYKVT